jgi:hypothetical protein
VKTALATPLIIPLCAFGLANWTIQPARAAHFNVPAGHVTIQAAVAAAAASPDADNFINLGVPRIETAAEIYLDSAFGPERRLTIRPDPANPELSRVLIASLDPFHPMLQLDQAGYVTIQDLDLVRQTINREDLVRLTLCTNVVVERCRFGSASDTAGAADKSILKIGSPKAVTVRNCIFFARAADTFAKAVEASLGSARNRLLWMYHNVAADYGGFGYEVSAHGDDAIVVFRNNIALNRHGLLPAPVAFHSAVAAEVQLFTSHNTAFAEEASLETIDPAGVSLYGAQAPLRFAPDRESEAFVEWRWRLDPPDQANPDLFRLLRFGLLHAGEGDAGQILALDGQPGLWDVAVRDDLERDARPSGNPWRADRGADQLDFTPLDSFGIVLPRLPVVTGIAAGQLIVAGRPAERLEVGLQTEPPPAADRAAMSGGPYRLSGGFESLVGRLPRVLPMALRVEFDGAGVSLSWPATPSRLVLEESPAVAGAAARWLPVPVAPTTIDGRRVVTLGVGPNCRFYRLAASKESSHQ